jgi:hypothetical protein
MGGRSSVVVHEEWENTTWDTVRCRGLEGFFFTCEEIGWLGGLAYLPCIPGQLGSLPFIWPRVH